MTASQLTIPICVDLDGTLIRTDILQESLYRFIRSNPFNIVLILFWFVRGRAYLKQQVSKRVSLDLDQLPVNQEFLAYLKEMQEKGVPLYLVTASDQSIADSIAEHFGIFTDTFASDGITNLRSKAKADFLVKKFGERGFLYAGNSRHDLSVWAKSRFAIVVNAPQNIIQSLHDSSIRTICFFENHYVFGGVIRLLAPLQWIKNFVFTSPLLFIGIAERSIFFDYLWAVLSYCLVDIWSATCRGLVRFKTDRAFYTANNQAVKEIINANPIATGQIYIATGFQLLCLSSLSLVVLYSILDEPYDAFIFIYGAASLMLTPIDLHKGDLRKFRTFILSFIILCSTLYYLVS